MLTAAMPMRVGCETMIAQKLERLLAKATGQDTTYPLPRKSVIDDLVIVVELPCLETVMPSPLLFETTTLIALIPLDKICSRRISMHSI